MIYYFRDHLGKGTAPLADIDSAIKSGTLSGQTLVSLDGETWQSVEAAQKPPALPPQPVAAPVRQVQVKKKTSRFTWLVLIMIGAVVFALFMQESTQSPEGNLEAIIHGTAMQAIRNRLKDGKGAEFDYKSIGWERRKDGAFEVWGDVRATNTFGAMLNNPFHIVMRENADGESFKILYVKIGSSKDGVYPPDSP